MCSHPNREAAMVVIDPGTPEKLGRDGIWCDPCLEPLIRALNAGGIRTVASCCGHGDTVGRVSLADGRELIIADREASERIAEIELRHWIASKRAAGWTRQEMKDRSRFGPLAIDRILDEVTGDE